jgi:hypothetical protein
MLVLGSVGAGLAAPVARADPAPTNTSPPSVSGLAVQGQTLTASSGSWAGTTPFTFAYQWERCNQSGAACSSVASATGQTYAVPAADVGSTLRVQVTATNNAGSAQMLSDPTSVVAAASAPVNTSAPTLSGSAQLAQTLTVGSGSWSGEPPPTYAYQWQRCDSAGNNCANIAAASGLSYTVVAADVGDRLQAVVTATNSAGTTSKASNQSAAATGAGAPPVAPANTSHPTMSGTQVAGQTLTANPGSWSGTAPIAFAYQWQLCNSSGGACTNIVAGTGQTFVLDASDFNDRVQVLVTASNRAGTSMRLSGQSSPIHSAPANSAQPSLFGNASEGKTLSLGTGDWIGSPPIAYSYQWQRCDNNGGNCQNIPGATNHDYTLGALDVGAQIQALVTAVNPLGSASKATPPSAPVTATLATPAWTAPPSILGVPLLGNTLHVGNTSWTGFPVPAFTYQWQRCTTNATSCFGIPGATTTAYRVGSGDVGRMLRVLVTAANTVGTTMISSQRTAAVMAPKPQRLGLAARALQLQPSHVRIRLALTELRGQFNVSLWLELDAWQHNHWQPITTTLVAQGTRQTTKLVSFQVRPNQSRARISISWLEKTNQLKASSYLAGPSSLRTITASTSN